MKYPPFFDSFNHVMRAGWLKAAILAEQWRDGPLIYPDRKNEDAFKQFIHATNVHTQERKFCALHHKRLTLPKALSRSMDMSEHLFQDFSPVSKDLWLERMKKELKGRSPEELNWHLDLDNKIVTAPFYNQEDQPVAPLPILTKDNHKPWEIGEYITVNQVNTANDTLLEGLNGGVQAPLLQFGREHQDAAFMELLQGVDLRMISTHFAQNFPEKDPHKLLYQFVRVSRKMGYDPADLSGSIDCDPILDWPDPPFEMLSDMIKFSADAIPGFKVLQINARRLHSGPENSAWELGYIISKANEYLAQMSLRGLAPGLVHQHMQFSVTVSTSFFTEIAKLRALKLLWARVIQAWDIDPAHLPPIEVHLAPETQSPDQNTNLIKAATQVMSAAIGGASIIYVLPSNAFSFQESTSFTRRMARNVQHILQMESHLDKVADPAAGSYFVEALTDKLCTEAWAIFQDIESKGGYLIAG